MEDDGLVVVRNHGYVGDDALMAKVVEVDVTANDGTYFGLFHDG